MRIEGRHAPRGVHNESRKAEWVRLRQKGHTYADIAAFHGVTRQAVHHAIGGQNPGGIRGRPVGIQNRDGKRAPIEPCASCGRRAPGLFCGSDCRKTWENERRLAT